MHKLGAQVLTFKEAWRSKPTEQTQSNCGNFSTTSTSDRHSFVALYITFRNWSARRRSRGWKQPWTTFALQRNTKSAIKGAVRLGDGEFTEWSTTTSRRPGVDAFQRSSGDEAGQRAVRMTVRRAVFAPEFGMYPRTPQAQ